MFSGIIEQLGTVTKLTHEANNLRLAISCPFVSELKIDQSISHNGACLTVDGLSDNVYEVVCINETLLRTNLGELRSGDKINLERSLRINARLDGHIVQGHVDETGLIREVVESGGSWLYRISYSPSSPHLTVQKGSVCVNGVSLTVVESAAHEFTVAVIPYTFEHTTFHTLQTGDKVNLEFDILGKYIRRILSQQGLVP